MLPDPEALGAAETGRRSKAKKAKSASAAPGETHGSSSPRLGWVAPSHRRRPDARYAAAGAILCPLAPRLRWPGSVGEPTRHRPAQRLVRRPRQGAQPEGFDEEALVSAERA